MRARARTVHALFRAQKTIKRLRAIERKRLQTQRMLENRTYELGERVKELNCLYSISNIVENQSNSLEDILRNIVEIIPDAWQYPEITCSRITINESTYATETFLETPWKQSQGIFVDGTEIGCLEILYTKGMPEKDEGPFLKEERSLINVIAGRIGAIIEMKRSQAALQKSQARNRALLDAIPDLMFRIDNTGKILAFHEGGFDELKPLQVEITGKSLLVLSEDRRFLPRRTVEQVMAYVTRAFETGKPQDFEQRVNVYGRTRSFEVRIVIIRENEALGIVRDITSRKRLENEIIEISGREQRRIGQDLHDSLCQHLAGVGFLCKALGNRLDTGMGIKPADVTEIIRHLDEAITLTRRFAQGLNPVRLESNGLIYALSELAVTAEKLFGISCRFEYNDHINFNDVTRDTHLYRIVQEALNNAIKHGNAGEVLISFIIKGPNGTLSVKDNGCGFSSTPGKGRGMGLNIMQYRASMIGASLEIRNHEDGGAEVVCSFQNRKDI